MSNIYTVKEGAELSCGLDSINSILKVPKDHGACIQSRNLTNVDFTGAVLNGIDFGKAKLTGAVFSEANLYRSRFTKEQAKECQFSEGQLEQMLIE